MYITFCLVHLERTEILAVGQLFFEFHRTNFFGPCLERQKQ